MKDNSGLKSILASKWFPYKTIRKHIICLKQIENNWLYTQHRLVAKLKFSPLITPRGSWLTPEAHEDLGAEGISLPEATGLHRGGTRRLRP